MGGIHSLPTNKKQVTAQYYISPPKEPAVLTQTLLSLLRQNIKYVFILYQEDRSFDHHFGTYPGAEGIRINPPAQTPGYTQSIQNPDASTSKIRPFRIEP